MLQEPSIESSRNIFPKHSSSSYIIHFVLLNRSYLLFVSKYFVDGYIYYDLFNQILGSNMVKLVSPVISGGEDSQLCFSFWYAAFGAGDSAVMQLIRQDNGSNSNEMEKVSFGSHLILK